MIVWIIWSKRGEIKKGKNVLIVFPFKVLKAGIEPALALGRTGF
jgi:hypothetical protein